jgi:hypothetical protein
MQSKYKPLVYHEKYNYQIKNLGVFTDAKAKK